MMTGDYSRAVTGISSHGSRHGGGGPLRASCSSGLSGGTGEDGPALGLDAAAADGLAREGVLDEFGAADHEGASDQHVLDPA